MRFEVVFLALFLVANVCPAETLKELLIGANIPIASFGKDELSVNVDGSSMQNEQRILIAYKEVKAGSLVGPIRMTVYNKGSGAIVRRNMNLSEVQTSNCDGAIEGISSYRSYIVLEMHLTPSASCYVFADESFKVVRVIEGIDWFEIYPNRIVIVENMMHFAPVHPERLQLLDLLKPGSKEIYPLKDDALRAHFIGEHAKHMPSDEVCGLLNDPCDSKLFDESVGYFASDGRGKFALLVNLDASHATEKETPPITVLSRDILYIYQQDKHGWLYCEQPVEDSEVEILGKEMSGHFEKVASRCIPNLPVVPDRTTSDFSPFPEN
jgi:hypothetical protein